jgi:hypothetical protein
MRWMRCAVLIVSFISLPAAHVFAKWSVLPPDDERRPLPKEIPSSAKDIKPGDAWPDDQKFRWLLGDLVIPEHIEGKPTLGKPVGMQIECGDGGEVWVDGVLQTRYDNDHPALVIVSDKAEPGTAARVGVLVYGKVQGGDKFGRADWVLLDPARATQPFALPGDASKTTGDVPADGLVGLSQGGGMSDYSEATARKLREGGFRWFRMDNVLTSAAKRGAGGKFEYDFAEMDKRLDFVRAIGAEPILAASYMPQAFDAVKDDERHSAPADYAAWEELCARAAKHARDRGTPVKYWEVWNETNAGWLKPGPKDTGSEAFVALVKEASGKEPKEKEVVRRFEAYCKLYRATALGVRRGDPHAKVGGPALASGPYDAGGDGPGVHGRTFARGLMLYCDREQVPFDFLSWHEYFQPADVIAAQAKTFRELAGEIPSLRGRDLPLYVTEWNEAWWPDRPHDNEIGAAWCADGLIRCFIPHRAKPCLFYAKQGDEGFRGDWGILMGPDNKPKPTYNAAKVFNRLSGKWLDVQGGDGEISCVAALDARRLQIVVVNFQPRYNARRSVKINLRNLPPAFAPASVSERLIDATHANAWNDANSADKYELCPGNDRPCRSGDALEYRLLANSVLEIDLVGGE